MSSSLAAQPPLINLEPAVVNSPPQTEANTEASADANPSNDTQAGPPRSPTSDPIRAKTPPPQPSPSTPFQATPSQTPTHATPPQRLSQAHIKPGTVASRIQALKARSPEFSSPAPSRQPHDGQSTRSTTGKTGGRRAQGQAQPGVAEAACGESSCNVVQQDSPRSGLGGPPWQEDRGEAGAAQTQRSREGGESSTQTGATTGEAQSPESTVGRRPALLRGSVVSGSREQTSATVTKGKHAAYPPYCRHGRPLPSGLVQPHVLATPSPYVGSKHRGQVDAASPWGLVAKRVDAEQGFGRAVCQECAYELARRSLAASDGHSSSESEAQMERRQQGSSAGVSPFQREEIVKVADKDGTHSTTFITASQVIPAPSTGDTPHPPPLHANAVSATNTTNANDPPHEPQIPSQDQQQPEHAPLTDDDLTHLTSILDGVIATHSAKLRAVTEALKRELDSLLEGYDDVLVPYAVDRDRSSRDVAHMAEGSAIDTGLDEAIAALTHGSDGSVVAVGGAATATPVTTRITTASVPSASEGIIAKVANSGGETEPLHDSAAKAPDLHPLEDETEIKTVTFHPSPTSATTSATLPPPHDAVLKTTRDARGMCEGLEELCRLVEAFLRGWEVGRGGSRGDEPGRMLVERTEDEGGVEKDAVVEPLVFNDAEGRRASVYFDAFDIFEGP